MGDVARVTQFYPLSLESTGGKLLVWWGNSENLLKPHQGADDAEKQSKGLKGWRQSCQRCSAGLELQNNTIPCLLHNINYNGVATFPPRIGQLGWENVEQSTHPYHRA